MHEHHDSHNVEAREERGAGEALAALAARVLARLLGRRTARRGARAYEVPLPPEATPEAGALRFFGPHEARTVDALLARILPSTEDGPGAREAGALNYIDYLLAQDDAFAQPIYRQPPFARAYDESPPATPSGDDSVIWVERAELGRYGFQSALDPREMYRRGLPQVDRYCRDRFGADFVDLAAERQDEVIAALAADRAEGFGEPGARAFFELVEEHAIEGTFCDPQYGGNRDMVAWKAIGFLGAQRAYSAEDMKSENLDLAPQSLAEMHALHARLPEQQSDIHETLAMKMERVKRG